MPVRRVLGSGELLPLLHLGETLIFAVLLGIARLVTTFFVGGEEAAERNDGSRGTELSGAALALNVERDRGGRALRVGHLGGHGALPNELIQAELVAA